MSDTATSGTHARFGIVTGILGLVVLTMTSLAAPARAQPGDPCGFWAFGANYAVEADPARNVLFTGSGGAVLIWDVTDPAAPTLLSDLIQTNGLVQDLFFDPSNQRLYIAADEGGLEVWDVQVPNSPLFLGRHDLTYFSVPVPAKAVQVQGDFAYIAADFGLVQWVDITDPSNMHTAGFNGEFNVSPARDVFIADGFLYAAGDSMVKFDIRPDGSLRAVKVNQSFGRRIFVRGDYGYLADPSISDFIVIDIVGVPSSLFLPVVGSYSVTGNVREVVLDGDRAFAADPFAGITVFDATNPEALVQTGMFAGGASRLIFNGDTGYTASGSVSRIIDFTDPDHPAEISTVGVSAGLVYDSAADGDYAYLASSSGGLQVLDVHNPDQPYRIAQLSVPGSPLDVEIAGRFAYLAAQSGGLVVIDISDPVNPVVTGTATGFTYARNVSVQGDYAYVTELHSGVRVIDVADRANPQQVEFISIPTGPTAFVNDVFVRGTRLYVVASDYIASQGTLSIFDVTDPANPIQLAEDSTVGEVEGIFVDDDLAYLAITDPFGVQLKIVDVSNPASLQVVGSYSQPGLGLWQVAVVAGKAYAAEVDDGVRVFDVSDPTDPTPIDFIDTPGSAFTVALDSGRVYVADGVAGVRIFGACSCVGDLNGDGTINLGDLATLLSNYGASGVAYEEGDLDGDGDVDLGDLSILLSVFGTHC